MVNAQVYHKATHYRHLHISHDSYKQACSYWWLLKEYFVTLMYMFSDFCALSVQPYTSWWTCNFAFADRRNRKVEL